MATPKPLSPKQLKFVELYLGGSTAKQAYIDAGYKGRGRSAEAGATQLLRNNGVARLIEEARNKAVVKALTAADLTAERLTLEVARLVNFDPRRLKHPDGRWKDVGELDDDTAACVASIEFEVPAGDDPTPVVKRIKVWDKNAAIKTGTAVLGMVTEKKEITGARGGPIAVDLRSLADADLDALLAILGRAARPGGADGGGGAGGEGPAPAG